MDYPITKGKGLEGQNCNRTACQEPNSAYYYNSATKAWYCRNCMQKINRSALRDGYDLFPDRELNRKTEMNKTYGKL